jgi:hypothetical protein
LHCNQPLLPTNLAGKRALEIPGIEIGLMFFTRLQPSCIGVSCVSNLCIGVSCVSNLNSISVIMSELYFFLLIEVLIQNFSIMDLVKFLGKNQKLHI